MMQSVAEPVISGNRTVIEHIMAQELDPLSNNRWQGALARTSMQAYKQSAIAAIVLAQLDSSEAGSP